MVGAGVAGLAGAIALASEGRPVTVLERAAAPGGKMRQVHVGGQSMDAGPTVLTMRWIFDELCAQAGRRLEDYVTLSRAEVLARHAWSETERLDLFASRERSAEAIATLAGPAEARGYLAFCRDAAALFATLDPGFIRAEAPSPMSLVRDSGPAGIAPLWRVKPFHTLWEALGRYFADPRLRQLFGRYSTYCGSSPFEAPATLMIIAHCEREGVWLIDGGMHALARGLARLAGELGAELRYGCHVEEIVLGRGRPQGVRLAGGEFLEADQAVVTADIEALRAGLLGAELARAVPPRRGPGPSLSAVTWNLLGRAGGFPLLHHNVFFSSNYRQEFDALFAKQRLPADPTIYVCAQDRDAEGRGAPPCERLFLLANAPATGERLTEAQSRAYEQACFDRLARCGLHIEAEDEHAVRTTPRDFEALFPGTAGALYGPATHGWRGAFQRCIALRRVRGVQLAGGSVHPGAGVPMAALSGRMAAERLRREGRSR